MHYQRYTDTELNTALAAAQAFHDAVSDKMIGDTTGTAHCWQFLSDLEWEIAAMQDEQARRAERETA